MALTLEQLNALVEKAFALEQDIDQIKKTALAPKQEQLDKVEALLMEELEEAGLKTFKSPHGAITVNTRYSYKTPKTEEEKKQFLDFVKESKGDAVMWAMTSVNSQTLNAYANQEMMIAKEEGNYGFKIPGIGEPTANKYLSRRKK